MAVRGTPSLSATREPRTRSRWRHERAWRHKQNNNVTSGATKLDVDDAVKDKVDGKIDEEQAVDDDRGRLVGEVFGAWRLCSSLQDVFAEEIQQSRRSDAEREDNNESNQCRSDALLSTVATARGGFAARRHTTTTRTTLAL